MVVQLLQHAIDVDIYTYSLSLTILPVRSTVLGLLVLCPVAIVENGHFQKVETQSFVR